MGQPPLTLGRTENNPRCEKCGLGFALDHILSSKKLAQESGEVSQRTYWEHERTCDRIIASLGKNRLLSEIDVSSLEKLRSDLATFGPDYHLLGVLAFSSSGGSGRTRSRPNFLPLSAAGTPVSIHSAGGSPLR